jgi:N-formylglutamate amidohydrolase
VRPLTASLVRYLAIVAALGGVPCAAQPQQGSAPLVIARSGDLPLLISAPHGGTLAVPGSSPRKGEGQPKGASGYFTGRDNGVEELAQETAAEVKRITGNAPYLVVASFHRKYADCNRPPSLATEDDAARAVYMEYHDAMRRACAEMVARWGGGLVIDIHGQGSSRSTVYRGTKNGLSTATMRDRFGPGVHNGPESLIGRLAARGWTVHPEAGGREQAGFTGGYITQTYGAREMGTDAVQLEFGADFRSTPAARTAAAPILARTLAEMARIYLDAPRRAPATKSDVEPPPNRRLPPPPMQPIAAGTSALGVEWCYASAGTSSGPPRAMAGAKGQPWKSSTTSRAASSSRRAPRPA